MSAELGQAITLSVSVMKRTRTARLKEKRAMLTCFMLLSLWPHFSACKDHSQIVYYKLEDDLLSSYKPHLRPVYSPNTTINVSAAMYVSSIQKLDETQQTLRHLSLMVMRWKDELLTWNPEHYSGIQQLELPGSMIWTPKLAIRNSASEGQEVKISAETVTVSYTGDIRWVPFGMLETSCSMNIIFYPFDTQICPVKIYLSAISDTEVNLSSVTASKSTDYVDNSEWNFVGFHIEKHQHIYDNGLFNKTYWMYSVSLRLERRRLFYSLTLLTPNVLLALLAALVFALPAECGEKMSFSMSLLLAFAVNLSVLMTAMPRSSLQLSLLMIYLTALSVVTALSIMATVYLLRLYHRHDNPAGRHTIGPKLTAVILSLQRVFDLQRASGPKKKRACASLYAINDGSSDLPNDIKMITPAPEPSKQSKSGFGILEKASREVDDDGNSALRWRDVAVTLDYVFFRIFLCLIVGITFVVVLRLFDG